MSKTTTNATTTEISQEELDSLLGAPGAEVAMTGAPETKPPSFFSNATTDLSMFDDKPEGATATTDLDPAAAAALAANGDDPAALAAAIEAAKKAEAAGTAIDPAENAAFIESITKPEGDKTPEELEAEAKAAASGSKKLDKAGMAQLAQTLIKDEIILGFDDDKAFEDYTVEDYKELFKMNFETQRKQIAEQTPKEFFDSLPKEMQFAAKYVADGGTDLQGLFKALAASEEVKALDITTERGQEATARRFLQASNFGTEAEIQEQIDSWRDLDKLEAKSAAFKPRLDAMQEQIVQKQVAAQEANKLKQEEAARSYADSIHSTLEKGELNGLKMSNKIQNMLYQGLIQPNYSSASGNQTNMFGHLIEKHQFVEPNHGLIAEALWLLADPEGYKTELKKGAKNDAAATTARELKSAQASKTGAGSVESEEATPTTSKARTISRAPKNFFKR